MPRLENWSIGTSNPYTAPELQISKLQGKVFNHPKGIFEDGDDIITSAITGIVEGDKIKTKSGMIYELGEPDPEYIKLFPDARERLIKSLTVNENENH